MPSSPLALSLAVLALVASAAAQSATPTVVSTLKFTHPAFCDLVTAAGEAESLAITTFTGNPFVGGTVGIVANIGDVPMIEDATVTELSSKMNWPNNVRAVPAGALAGFSGFGVGYGFLVPGKSVGGVALLSYDGGDYYQLTKNAGNPLNGAWFYHTAFWMDMDGDGLDDVVTARATKPILGTQSGQFVWLKQPASDPLSQLPWQETQLASGSGSPDVFFEPCDLNGDGQTEFVYASFFTGAGLGLAWKDPSATAWTPDSFHMMSIDDSIAPAFAVEVVDMNGDGNPDVLVSNHVNDPSKSGVWVYEAPQRPYHLNATSQWKKHQIATGFKVLTSGMGSAAPGAAFSFHPKVGATGKPSVMVGGDGAEGVYMITPNSEDPSDWSYTMTQVDDCKGTVGQLALGDTNGDGFTDIYVPCYDIGEIHQLSFNA